MNTIKTKLKNFKLAGISSSIEERVDYANANSLSYIQFLEILMEDETNNRQNNSYKKRYLKAKLPNHKTVENFDFNFQPSIDKKIINDCLTCNFISENKNIVFIGNPGTGKTHLSTSFAIKALMKGFKVLFTSVSEMLQNLHFSKADNSYYQKLQYYLSFDLLVLDELGFKKIPDFSTHDFFEVISKVYEHSSIIITTNKKFELWKDIFDDPILTSAILDRIIHYSTIIKIDGPSYRTRKLKKGGK
ncbi:MAG: ATP-binding protein [Ignavibacteriae bacterium]|nr:ATP-binding protein [Ignavibacteriota bacterium]